VLIADSLEAPVDVPDVLEVADSLETPVFVAVADLLESPVFVAVADSLEVAVFVPDVLELVVVDTDTLADAVGIIAHRGAYVTVPDDRGLVDSVGDNVCVAVDVPEGDELPLVDAEALSVAVPELLADLVEISL